MMVYDGMTHREVYPRDEPSSFSCRNLIFDRENDSVAAELVYEPVTSNHRLSALSTR